MKTVWMAGSVLLLAAGTLWPQSPQQLKRLFDQGNELSDRGDPAGAARAWEQGLDLARRSGNKQAVANFTRNLGLSYMDLGEYAKAAAVLEEAFEAFGALRLPKGQATALSSLGQVFTQTGEYDKALGFLERALELDRRIDDKLGVSICLRSMGNVHAARGEYRKARALYDESSAMAKALGDDDGLSADWTNLSIACRNMGDLDKALDYGERSLALTRKLGNAQAEAMACMALGNLHSEKGDFDKAQSLYGKTLELMRKAGNKDGVSDALINLSALRAKRGDPAKAAALIEEALGIKKELEDPKGEAVCLGSLADLYRDEGDLAAALGYYEKAVEVSRRIGDPQGLSEGLRGLGDARRKLGDYALSAKALEEALSAARGIEDKSGLAESLSAAGSLYVELGDQDKAVGLFEEALRLLREAQNRFGQSVTLNNLGVAYRALGRLEKAEKAFQEALAIGRDIGAPTQYEESNLAELDVQRGEVAAAEKVFLRLDAPIQLGRLYLRTGEGRKAVKAFERSQALGETARDPLAMAAEHTGLGQAHLLLGDLEKARASFEKAVGMAEDQREGLCEGERARFFEGDVLGFRRAEAYQGLVAAAAASGRPEDAFQRAEGLKARVLAEALAQGRLAEAGGLPRALGEEEARLTLKLRTLRKSWEALFRAADQEGTRRKEGEIDAVKKELDSFVRSLRASHAAYASIRYPKPIRPAEAALAADETLVEFAAAQGRVYRMVLQGHDKSLSVRELAVPLEELRALVRAFRRVFETAGSAEDLAGLDVPAGKRLYDLLLKGVPLEGSKLILVPDDVLGLLPFEALVTALPEKTSLGEGPHGPFPLGVRYLADEAEVTYAQSATALTLLRSMGASAKAGDRALAVVDPDFGPALAAAPGWKTMGVAGVRGREGAFPRLEKTRELGELFKALFKDKADVLSGAKAGEKALSALPLDEYRFVVFGTHGLLDADLPYVREPALVLSDGFLTMSEVMGFRLSAEAVALTACQTGVGRSVGGEGVMGMGRAFQYAGARSVLMSLWPVAEDGAVALSGAFFTALSAGSGPREALSQARERVRKAGWEHPFYWAAFVLMSP